MNINCIICKAIFKPKRKSQNTCSDPCYRKKRNQLLINLRKNDPKYIEREKLYRENYKKKNPEKYIENYKKGNLKQKIKYQSDPEYRQEQLAKHKLWLKKNPEIKQKIRNNDNARKRERYKKDINHRSQKLEKTKKYHRDNPDINLKSYLKLLDDPARLEVKKKRDLKYYEKNRESILEKGRAHYHKNKAWYDNYRKKYMLEEKNKERSRKATLKYYRTEYGKKKYREYRKQKLKNDPLFRAGINLRLRLYEFIKKGKYRKYGSFKDKLGCNWDFFKKHIESQFQKGMSWDNYGEWHIDHVIPLSLWDLSKKEDQEMATHYSNLQPLWAKDNIAKSNKL